MRSLVVLLFFCWLQPVIGQTVEWPAGEHRTGKLVLSMKKDSSLIKQLSVTEHGVVRKIASELDPVFLLRVGRRDLLSQNGWNIFFDKVPSKGYRSYEVRLEKKRIFVTHSAARTVVAVDGVSAPGFTGRIEITLYHGSLLMNIAAVVTTQEDSTAILYDAGLVSRGAKWDTVGWCEVGGYQLDPGAVAIHYEGIQLQQEFYTPVYDKGTPPSPRIPDFRNLLQWSPDINTGGEGKASLNFYTSDIPGTYLLFVQGITDRGQPGSKMVTFTVH